ncbi:MAG: SDR family oxidoreductase [Cyclobacteriaceae bacterium]
MTKRALILGGSSGIGKATVKKIADSFDQIVIFHRDRKTQTAELGHFLDGISASSECTILPYNLDATDPINMQLVAKESQLPFHLVVHAISRGNLGSLDPEMEHSLEADDLMLTMEAMCFNVKAWNSFLLSNKLLADGCRFITLTSEGSTRMWPGYGGVGLAKSALETLTKYLAVEMSKYGVRYNCLHPGVTDTPSLRMIPKYQGLMELTKNRNPYKRLTQPEDVANLIYLLTLPEADWINGSIIHVDGGEHLV